MDEPTLENDPLLKLRCFGERVMLRFPAKNEVTKGGIIIPDKSKDPDQPWICTAVAVGPGYRSEDGTYEPLAIKVGDKVLIDKKGGTGTRVVYENWTYLWTPASAPNVLGVVEE
jgi:chaperonin GroES